MHRACWGRAPAGGGGEGAPLLHAGPLGRWASPGTGRRGRRPHAARGAGGRAAPGRENRAPARGRPPQVSAARAPAALLGAGTPPGKQRVDKAHAHALGKGGGTGRGPPQHRAARKMHPGPLQRRARARRGTGGARGAASRGGGAVWRGAPDSGALRGPRLLTQCSPGGGRGAMCRGGRVGANRAGGGSRRIKGHPQGRGRGGRARQMQRAACYGARERGGAPRPGAVRSAKLSRGAPRGGGGSLPRHAPLGAGGAAVRGRRGFSSRAASNRHPLGSGRMGRRRAPGPQARSCVLSDTARGGWTEGGVSSLGGEGLVGEYIEAGPGRGGGPCLPGRAASASRRAACWQLGPRRAAGAAAPRRRCGEASEARSRPLLCAHGEALDVVSKALRGALEHRVHRPTAAAAGAAAVAAAPRGGGLVVGFHREQRPRGHCLHRDARLAKDLARRDRVAPAPVAHGELRGSGFKCVMAGHGEDVEAKG
jgi:hypothetical protein